jgi:hypothetical protein
MFEIHENARRGKALHGDRAELVASQKALECERSGNSEEAQNWQRVRAAIAHQRAPHNS